MGSYRSLSEPRAPGLSPRPSSFGLGDIFPFHPCKEVRLLRNRLTLIELLMIIAILGIIASILIPIVFGD